MADAGKLEIEIVGVSPLIMHNKRLADPLDTFARAMKEASGKRRKTDADIIRMGEVEWFGGLYSEPQIEFDLQKGDVLLNGQKPIIPADMLEACIQGAAKLQKLGMQFKSGFFVESDATLIVPTKKTVADLAGSPAYVDRRSMRVQRNMVMRVRPRFPEWSAKFTAVFFPDVVNRGQIAKALEDAGRLKGLGDSRPRYGRFDVRAMREIP